MKPSGESNIGETCSGKEKDSFPTLEQSEAEERRLLEEKCRELQFAWSWPDEEEDGLAIVILQSCLRIRYSAASDSLRHNLARGVFPDD